MPILHTLFRIFHFKVNAHAKYSSSITNCDVGKTATHANIPFLFIRVVCNVMLNTNHCPSLCRDLSVKNDRSRNFLGDSSVALGLAVCVCTVCTHIYTLPLTVTVQLYCDWPECWLVYIVCTELSK